MRSDMSKVVIERPRSGHQLPSGKTGLRIRDYDPEREYENMPNRVSGSRSKHVRTTGRKYFSDLLSPLRRYLRSNVGRPWNKVWSEMKQSLDSRKVTGQHIFDHVKSEVETNCYEGADGKVYSPYRGYGEHRPVEGLYVHPRTGLLCWKQPRNHHRERREKEAAQREVVLIPRSDSQYYLKIEGVWYEVELEYSGEVEKTPDGQPVNRWSDTQFVTRQIYQRGQRVWQIRNKRQCNSRELRSAKLSNELP